MSAEKEEILPKNWVKRESKSQEGKSYYWNSKTKASVWKLKDVFEREKETEFVKGVKTDGKKFENRTLYKEKS